MEDTYKEVYFGDFCRTCVNLKTAEDVDPCHECLNNPVNLYSHKPVNYKEDEEKVAKFKRRAKRHDQSRG